jgi:mRNA interferase RelE/StbE
VIYKVRIARKVQKKLSNISEPDYSKLKTSILDLGKNPRPYGYRKLKDRNSYRIRIGNYRVIYEIHDYILLVDVIDLGHRKDIYG